MTYPKVVRPFEGIRADILQLAAVLEKYSLISEHADPAVISALAASELEHTIVSIRSFYDQLQWIAKGVAEIVKDVKDPSRRLIRDLPSSFADMAMIGDSTRSEAEIETKFALPQPLARFYAGEAATFKPLRDVRVAIEHRGFSLPHIFALPDGLAVMSEESTWRALVPSPPPQFVRGKFVSFRGIIALLTRNSGGQYNCQSDADCYKSFPTQCSGPA